MEVQSKNEGAQIMQEIFEVVFGNLEKNKGWMMGRNIYVSYLKARKIIFEQNLATYGKKM